MISYLGLGQLWLLALSWRLSLLPGQHPTRAVLHRWKAHCVARELRGLYDGVGSGVWGLGLRSLGLGFRV